MTVHARQRRYFWQAWDDEDRFGMVGVGYSRVEAITDMEKQIAGMNFPTKIDDVRLEELEKAREAVEDAAKMFPGLRGQ